MLKTMNNSIKNSRLLCGTIIRVLTVKRWSKTVQPAFNNMKFHRWPLVNSSTTRYPVICLQGNATSFPQSNKEVVGVIFFRHRDPTTITKRLNNEIVNDYYDVSVISLKI